MSIRTLPRLTNIAEENGWRLQPLELVGGGPGGFVATRGSVEVIVKAAPSGRLKEASRRDARSRDRRHAPTDRAAFAADWLTEAPTQETR